MLNSILFLQNEGNLQKWGPFTRQNWLSDFALRFHSFGPSKWPRHLTNTAYCLFVVLDIYGWNLKFISRYLWMHFGVEPQWNASFTAFKFIFRTKRKFIRCKNARCNRTCKWPLSLKCKALSITALSITALSITALSITILSIMTFSIIINKTWHSA